MTLLIAWISILISFTNGEVIQLTSNNIKEVLNSNELVLVDFYASWCYFSNILDPIFTDASNKLEKEFKEKGKASLAKVDCEQASDLAKLYGIRKYPTLKLFRFGEVCKHEYRGARNTEAIINYIKTQLIDPIKEFPLTDKIKIEAGNSYLIGHFKSRTGSNFDLFRRIAYQMRDDCNFFIQINPDILSEKLTYEKFETTALELTELKDVEQVKQWIIKVCTPVVRGITFQNAEDITEEGLPLVLLFYSPKNMAVTEEYTKFILDHLMNETKIVNFVYADGQKFSHPLMHLSKSESDLPFIAIDSFQHMFVLPNKMDIVLKDASILRKFIADLLSGRLHREYHNGPDSASKPSLERDNKDFKQHQATPIPSVFKKLRPDSNRYTLFHDEF